MPKLSQYELEREANIARNRALLEQLELKQAVDGLGLPPPKGKSKSSATKGKPVQPAKRKREREPLPEAPRRQSARLRKNVIDPNESPGQRRKREREAEKQQMLEEEKRIEDEEKARMAKRPRHNDLKLAALAENGPEDLETLSVAFASIAENTYSRGVADFDAFVYDRDREEEAAVKELRKKLQELKVVSRAKVMENRVYCAAYHPEVTKDLIFFGDKHGQLGIWDAQAPQDDNDDDNNSTQANKDNREGGKYWRLQLHWPATSKSSISSIKFDPLMGKISYDCTIRSLSFTSGLSREIYATDDKVLISSIDLPPTGHEMWFSDANGGVTHIDLREQKSRARRYELSDQKIGCLSVNPTKPHFILTASNSRFLKVWDVRKLQTMVADLSNEAPPSPPSSISNSRLDEDTAVISQPIEFDTEVVSQYLETPKGQGCLRGEFKHDKSASSAYWDPRGRQIVSTSYDDTLRIWDIQSSSFERSDAFSSFKPFSRIRHNCQTGKWLTILRAQWNPNPDVYPHFTVGNMDHSLDIFSCKGSLITKLSDPSWITAVQAVTASHPSIVERAVSGNASGRCVLWAPPDNSI
ncbi:WD40-repeat-containing domain protein [Cyathus striatus]|nr:WD40-repeat-containing domain protein [Cyathus striatus]